MTRRIVFTVPGEPQGKGRPRAIIRGGKPSVHTPPKTAAYEALVGQCALAERTGPLLTGPLRVHMDIICAIPKSASRKRREAMLMQQEWPAKKPDPDNIAKAILDGAEGVAFENDAQVVQLTLQKAWGEKPGVTVRIAPMVAA